LSGRPPEMKEACAIPGVLRIALPGGIDPRGCFSEVFRLRWFGREFGDEVQVNCSVSEAGVLRGMHFHNRQYDLWYPCTGHIRAAFADVRVGSATFGLTDLLELRGEGSCAILIPPGVAHGYLAVERSCLVYVVDRYFDGSDEYGIAWDDPDLGIDWGCPSPILSERDRGNQSFRSLKQAGGKARGE